MAQTLINVKRNAKPGELLEITTLIAHPMETGFRADSEGKMLARDIVRRFSCSYDGETVFSAELFPAIAANPYIAFSTVATASGTLVFKWEGDHGFSQTENVAISVA
ncbi:MAG TPA: thiosulfate oxidation carrier complex protein SoxZ [Albitalea sp.]|nr:thiosulfate oxidation carrier complex protein SoxZ [Albitalea sp.]